MIQKALREYEVSIWSLQDEFLTVLKPAGIWSKGQIQEPEMILKVDGTQEFSFSIPMYYSVNGELKENPSWYTYKNGFIIAGMRKIKVILNKSTADEKVFEFVIIKVTENHDNNELMCDVECEGLAFQELGKVGYKISLASDDFYAEDLKWFNEHGATNDGPKATLNYWLNKFLKSLPQGSEYKDPNTWYYKIDMNWSAYNNRDSNKIYDDEYISAWTLNNERLVPAPGSIREAKEKERLVDLEESNKYNLTQDLAETFGVYCRYEYEHDENYYITGRTVVFYNTFFVENEKPIDINYRYNTNTLSREIDSTDLITKMFIQPVNSNESASGLISIMSVGANKMREDYLFNFDYLHDIKAISDEAYNFIPEYEARIHDINLKLEPLGERLTELALKIPEVEAKKQIADNAIQLDKERIGDSNKFISNLTGNDGTLEVTAERPDTTMLLKDNENPGSYYIKITQQGIIADTLKIYKTMNFGATNERRLMNQMTTGRFQYDDAGNLIKITNLFKGNENDSSTVYLLYRYRPQLYYENIRRAWEQRLAKDQADQINYGNELVRLNNLKDSLDLQNENLLDQKKNLIEEFEALMGPALREGYWQPEDYADYGEKHTAILNGIGTGSSGLEEFVWDENLLDGEQDISFFLGSAQISYNYPCIDLSEFNDITNINQYSLIFTENSVMELNNNSINNQRIFSVGSELIPCYLKNNNIIKPILIVKGAETLSNDALFNMFKGGKLGIIDVNVATSGVSVQVTNVESVTWIIGIDEQNKNFLLKNNNLKSVYPRVKIKSLALKTSEDQFSLKYNNNVLVNYEDFSMFTYVEEQNQVVESGYNITIKPEVLMQNNCKGIIDTIELIYTLSNADVAIYLDALEVLLDSSRPQVSYSVDVSMIYKEFVKNLYKILGRIVNINDPELKFENVQGYVSELTLYLDTPWEDTLGIKSYRNKFEDLFATIVAQTESMKKNEVAIAAATQAFSPSGELKTEVLKDTMRKTDLNFAFNNGKLTIDEANGIWGTSDTGVVAYRGGGIFTATEKDSDGSWIWNSGITPEGISADQITVGQLDTNKVNIYGGDNLRFQLNGDGLFAYKSFAEDFKWLNGFDEGAMDGKVTRDDGLDPLQYVVLNENGLFLKAKTGAYLLNSTKTAYKRVIGDIDRVEVSWDGFKIRNLNNKEVFYADTDGNLTLDGRIIARELIVGGDYNDIINTGQDIDTYINERAVTLNDLINALNAGETVVENVFDKQDGTSDIYIIEKLSDIELPFNPNVNDIVYNYSNNAIEVTYNNKTQVFAGNTIYKLEEIGEEGASDTWEIISNDIIKNILETSVQNKKNNDSLQNNLQNLINLDLNQYKNLIDGDLQSLQAQIDHEINTWFFSGTPVINEIQQNNKQGKRLCIMKRTSSSDLSDTVFDEIETEKFEEQLGITWNDNEVKYNEVEYDENGRSTILDRHLADVYYNISESTYSKTAGQAFRFIYFNGDLQTNAGYMWEVIESTATTEALAAAATAQETADGKIRTFIAAQQNNNLVPNIVNENFGIGDLWINSTKNNQLYRYNGTNWILASTNSVVDVDVEYAISESSSQAPQSGWSTTIRTLAAGEYLWSRTKTTFSGGEEQYTTPVCLQTAEERSIEIEGPQIVIYNPNLSNNQYSPSTITLTANAKGLTIDSWWWYNNNGWNKISAGNGITISNNKQNITFTSENISWNDNELKIRVLGTIDENNSSPNNWPESASYYDEFTVHKLSEGQNGASGSSSTSIFFTNETISIPANANGQLNNTQARTFTTYLVGYEGTTKISNLSISSVSGSYSGITCTYDNNNKINNQIPVTITVQPNIILSSNGSFQITTTGALEASLVLNWIRMDSAINTMLRINATKTVFSDENNSAIELTAKLHKGNILEDVTAASTWSGSTLGTLTPSNNKITIERNDIAGTETIICSYVYQGVTYRDTITIQDKTDPITCVIESSNGDKFTEGKTNTVLTCHVYNNQGEIDILSEESNHTYKYFYKWTIGENTFSGKQITLQAAQITNKMIINCSVYDVNPDLEQNNLGS